MSNEQQWIPLRGPGGRLPTEADASDKDKVYVYDERSQTKDMFYRSSVTNGWTHWAPIPKAPPLPKPVEKTQRLKDLEKYRELCTRNSTTNADDVTGSMAWARSDGRAQLARECLNAADRDGMLLLIYSGDRIRMLHDLLTKAAEGTP